MSRILTRYLGREVVSSSLLVMLAFIGLFAFFDFVNELDALGKNGYTALYAAVYVFLIMPGRVYELMPIGVLIGTLYALTTLARHSEITVMRTSGLSTWQFLGVLSRVGLIFVVMTFVFGEYIAPPAERAAKQFRLAVTGSSVSSELRSGVWVKDGGRFVNVRNVQPDRSLEDVRIYNFSDQFELEVIQEAARAEYDNDSSSWKLRDVRETRFAPETVQVQQVPETLWRSELTPEVLSVLMVQPERMSVGTLYTYIRHLRENRQNSDRYEIALWKKIVYPLAVLVMMALALPFGYSHDRMGGVSLKVFIGIMFGVSFHLMNGLFSSLGIINDWSPMAAALLPSLIFLTIATGMLWWVERR